MQENENHRMDENEIRADAKSFDNSSTVVGVNVASGDPSLKTLSEVTSPNEQVITSEFAKNVISLSALNFLPLLFSILLLKAPQVIFRIIDGIWANMFIPVIMLFFVIGMSIADERGNKDERLFSIQIIASVLTLTLTVLGFCFAHTHTYELSNPRDFKLLNHMPIRFSSDNYYKFEVTNDIDFEGYKVREEYNGFLGIIVIEGNGYTIRNIKYSSELEQNGYFIYLGYQSKISNLNFDNCEFEITPNSYDKKTHEGKEVTFSIISAASLDNVNINATVYIKNTEEDLNKEK